MIKFSCMLMAMELAKGILPKLYLLGLQHWAYSSTRHVLGLASWIMISLFAREQVWKMFCFNSSSFPEIALPFHFLGRLLGFSIWSAKKSSGEERSQQLVLSHGGIASDLGDGSFHHCATTWVIERGQEHGIQQTRYLRYYKQKYSHSVGGFCSFCWGMKGLCLFRLGPLSGKRENARTNLV